MYTNVMGNLGHLVSVTYSRSLRERALFTIVSVDLRSFTLQIFSANHVASVVFNKFSFVLNGKINICSL